MMLSDEEIWESLEKPPSPTPPVFRMQATRGKNLIAVGWDNGVLRCAFASKGGARFYCYGGVPEAEKEKLIHSPFPDRLFTTNIKGKYSVVSGA